METSLGINLINYYPLRATVTHEIIWTEFYERIKLRLISNVFFIRVTHQTIQVEIVSYDNVLHISCDSHTSDNPNRILCKLLMTSYDSHTLKKSKWKFL